MAPGKDRTHGGHKHCPSSTTLRTRSTAGVQGVGAPDFDADGRCQAFCFPVRREREIPALKCSLEERHQHLLGKQMESRVRRPGAARHEEEEEEEEEGRQEWGSLQAAPVAQRIFYPSPCASAGAHSWIPNLTRVRGEFAHRE